MKKRLLLLPLMAGLVLSGCEFEIAGQKISFGEKTDNNENNQDENNNNKENDGDVEAVVKSVAISSSVTEVGVGKTAQLSANVTVEGNAAKTVEWTSDNTSVATINKTSGKVTGVAEGTAVITATSTVDNTKSAYVTITVVDQGFDSTFIDEGYTYSNSFDEIEEALRAFLGDGNYDIVDPVADAGGYYYIENAADEDYGSPAYFEVVIDGIKYEDYADALLDAGFDKVFESSQGGIEAVDPTLTYTLLVSCDYDEDTWEDVAPTYIDFYKSSDVWYDGTLTSDVAWNEEHYDDMYDEEAEKVDDIVAELPFIAMGENYIISYVDMSFYRYFGIDYPDYVSISDYSIDDSILEGYDGMLETNGFVYDAESDMFIKEFAYSTLSVYYEWGESGNTIYVLPGLAELDAWPTDGVNDFVTNTIESIRSVPVYDKTADAVFTFEVTSEYIDEETMVDLASITVDHVLIDELEAYVADCETAGYKVAFTEGTDEDYPYYSMQNGKVCIQIVFVQDYDEDNETYSETEGSLQFYIYGDENGHEVPGIYFPESSGELMVGETLDLSVEIVDLGDNQVVTYTSSDDTKATIDANGIVTAVAITEENAPVTITASTTYNDTNYSVSYELTVVEYVEQGVTFDFSVINTTSGTLGKYSFTTDIGTGQSAPAWNSNKNELRLYIGNTMTISSTVPMTSIFFDANTCGESKATGTLSADVGTITAVDGGFEWTGNATEVVFTCDEGKQVHINSIDVNGGGESGSDDGLATPLSVATELSYAFFGQSSNVFTADGSDYYIGFTWGTNTEYTLLTAIEEAIDYLPESYVIATDPYEDVWDDESEGAFATAVVDNIVVELGSWEEDGDICVQIYVCEAQID